MVVVELVLRHTRHTSPTRRVAVERFSFPEAGAPHAAGVLLAGTEPLRIPPNGSRPRLGKREERALRVLGFASHERPTRVEVMAAFRRLARETHPDHGGVVAGAGQRMAELSSARELLLRHVPSV